MGRALLRRAHFCYRENQMVPFVNYYFPIDLQVSDGIF